MRQLEIVGPFRGASGYDHHTRELVRHIVRRGVHVRLHQLHGWSLDLPAALREPWFDELAASDVRADTVLHFTMPPHADPHAGKRNVNYTMFEADRIPADWVWRAKEHDLVIVPTESSRDAWVASGVDVDRVRVSPLGVDAQRFLDPSPPLALTLMDGRPLSDVGVRFLNIAELRPRKNALGLIRCWLRATSADDDAVLILKQTAYQQRVVTQFQSDLAGMLQREGLSLERGAPIVVIDAFLSDAEVRALHATATHYISMSKGEGWDNPMMEAAVAGLSLVAPRHSAYVSYLADGDAHWIPATPVPATFEGEMGREDEIFFAGLSWWQPDEEAAVEIIRAIVRGHAPRVASPRARLAADYGWEQAAESLLRVMGEDA